MSSSEREQLRPCPFCGCEDVALWLKHRVLCPRCEAEGPSESEEAAVNLAAWNRRATAGTGEPVATVYTMEALVPGGSVKCHAQLHKALPAGTKLYAAPQRAPLTDAQIDDLHGDSNRGFSIERDDYFKAFRDAERAHGITAAKESNDGK